MNEKITFFSALIENIIMATDSLDGISTDNTQLTIKIKIEKNILSQIRDNPKEFDEMCPYTIGKFEGELRNSILSISSTTTQQKEIIINNMFRVLYELSLEFISNSLKENSITRSLDGEIEFIKENFNKLDSRAQKEIQKIENKFQYELIKYTLNSHQIKSFVEFTKNAARCDKINSDTKREILEIEGKIKLANDNVEEIKTKANFVALNKGFEKMRIERKTALRNSRILVGIFGLLIILPIFIEISTIHSMIDNQSLSNTVQTLQNKDLFGAPEIQNTNKTEINPYYFIMIIPMVALEIFLLYFFRISLIGMNELKAQILQLDLRMTLCQFIQSYSHYAKEIKENDKVSLDKFENLIFSSILMNGTNIPTTFDGIDQITKLIAATRNGKN